MLTPDALADVAATCAKRDVWFISDEIYHGLNYEMPQACALSTNRQAIVINSFSKYYCMTGWRIGWMIVPEVLQPHRRVPVAKPLHLRPDAVAVCRHRRVRCDRGTGGEARPDTAPTGTSC